jgi:hypothetical protein
MKTAEPPRPTTTRRIWFEGFQYAGETTDQMNAREERCREEDRRIKAELERLWQWKLTPIWKLK